MKFVNTKTQAIQVKKDAKVAFDANVALAKSIFKMPSAIVTDVSNEVKTAREARKAYEEWKASRES